MPRAQSQSPGHRQLQKLETFRGKVSPNRGDLFDTAFWKAMQQRTSGGEVIEFFRYEERRRLRPFSAPAAPAR